MEHPEKIARAYVDRINAGDVNGLLDLMPDDYAFVDVDGTIEQGKGLMREGWAGYFSEYPDYPARRAGARRTPPRRKLTRGGDAMNHIGRTALVLCVGALLLVPSAAAAAESDRTETVLTWDDGEPDGPLVYGGMLLVVEFQAPEWANLVVGAHVYIWSDTLAAPHAAARETRPIRIWVPDGGPGGATIVDGGYPVQAWLEVAFPEPVDVTDPGQFPDREFFVGVEWLHPWNPVLGVDTDPPIDGRSWGFESGWVPFDEFDVMVRAVVADTLVTPVDPRRWGVIKAGYR